MKLHRNTYKLLVVAAEGVITDQVGMALRVQPSAEDNTPDTDQTFGVHAILTMVGDGKQNVRAKLQTSIDKINWIDVLETPRVTSSATEAFTKDAPALTLLPWVRAVTVLGGLVKPSHKATIWLTSDGPFRCRIE
ncbi:MAG: hypothetical protein ABMB14_40845 [Myxococcota bacterium]